MINREKQKISKNNSMSGKRSLWWWPEIAVFILVGLLGSGCEPHFDPLQENNRYRYSMYGLLNVHSDSQWVRVMPILDTLISQNPEPLGVEVSIRRESTGDLAVFNDSLFFYGGQAYAWNFRSFEPIHPEETYTVWVAGPDGEICRAEVHTPAAIPPPSVTYDKETEQGIVEGEGVENLVVAETTYRMYVIDIIEKKIIASPPFSLVLSHLGTAQVQNNGEYFFTIDAWPMIEKMTGYPRNRTFILSREVLVVSGSEDWPDLSGLDEERIVLPDFSSNVENGTGLVAGVAGQRVSLESCYDDEGELVACDKGPSI